MRRLLRLRLLGLSAVEVVDVAKPLAELEDDALVRGGGGRRTFEGECPFGRLRVEALAQEETCPHLGAEHRRDQAGLCAGKTVEQRECGAGGIGGLRQALPCPRTWRPLRGSVLAPRGSRGSERSLLGQGGRG